MPLDDSEFEQLVPSKSQIAIMRDFLEDNAPQAYTLEEIAAETEVITASSSGGQIPAGSGEQGLAHAIGRVYLELLAECSFNRNLASPRQAERDRAGVA